MHSCSHNMTGANQKGLNSWVRSVRSVSAQWYREEARLYASHHRHRGNWWLHTACVPVEWTAWLMVLSLVDLARPFALAMMLYYVLLLPTRYRYLGAAGQWVCALMADRIVANAYDSPAVVILPFMSPAVGNVLVIAVSMQMVAWFVQVCIGHCALEGNSPSMAQRLTLNSVVLSLLLAWDADIK